MRATTFFTVAILATSCGIIKNVTKHRDKTNTEMDSTATSHVDAATTERVETNKITTEEADTSAVVKGSTVQGSSSLKDLADHPLVLDNDTLRVTVRLDADGRIRATGKNKDQLVNLKYRRRTEEKILADRQTKTKTDTKLSEKKSTSSKTTATDKTVKRWGVPWYYGILIVLALLIAVYLTLRKRIPFLP